MPTFTPRNRQTLFTKGPSNATQQKINGDPHRSSRYVFG
jgi:hypothetical protein